MKLQKDQITLPQAVDCLFGEKIRGESRKVRSNRRLKDLCGALQRASSAAKIRELKRRLRHEFYSGDQAP